jgi:hypothetical protein
VEYRVYAQLAQQFRFIRQLNRRPKRFSNREVLKHGFIETALRKRQR